LLDVLGRYSGITRCGQLLVKAWRGHEGEVRELARELGAEGREIGIVISLVDYASMVLDLSLGHYEAAAARARPDWHWDLTYGGLRAADAVEAHVRSGNTESAIPGATYLADRAAANASALDLGLLARCRALLASDDEAEEHFRVSIARLEETGAKLHVARSRLLYGEWLRRQKRRRDAREQLGLALETFSAAGAVSFCERARIELLATGAQARKRVDETRQDLSPQESQIARLAAGGLTNPEIAARLFLSASTVDYHLRKVYRKLNIKSRHEIAGMVAES
jgi:DNA-binding CsgD family transcriptional regulator